MLTPITGKLGTFRAAHLLRRIAFGYNQADLKRFSEFTAEEAEQAIFGQELSDPPPPIDPATKEPWITDFDPEVNSETFELRQYVLRWNFGQYLAPSVGADQKVAYRFRENLIFFLHTYFTTRSTALDNRFLYYQIALFRAAANNNLDGLNLKYLTKAITLDQGMLRFLDGRLNLKGAPNENYARELLELYTVGKGLPGRDKPVLEDGDYLYFTEQDVQEAAKVLSGWTTDTTFAQLDPLTNLPRGKVRGSDEHANQHENSIKTFSFRFANQQVIPQPELLNEDGNPTLESALDEIDQLIEIIFSSTENAQHFCRKLFGYFVYPSVSEQMETTIIADMAEVLRESDYSIHEVVKRLIFSEEFYNSASYDFIGNTIKNPIQLVLGFYISQDYEVPDLQTDYERYYSEVGKLMGFVKGMGLDYFEPFEVAGYSAYHQYPGFHRQWITANYITKRYDFIARSFAEKVEGDTNQLKYDPVLYVKETIATDVAKDARLLVLALAARFLPVRDSQDFDNSTNTELTEERLNYFIQAFLFSPQIDLEPEEAWTTRWVNGFDPETVQNQLVNLFNALLQTPEYQLM